MRRIEDSDNEDNEHKVDETPSMAQASNAKGLEEEDEVTQAEYVIGNTHPSAGGTCLLVQTIKVNVVEESKMIRPVFVYRSNGALFWMENWQGALIQGNAVEMRKCRKARKFG